MGEENNVTTVEEIREDVINEIENEENEQSSNCGFKQAAGVAAITTLMLGAGYGLYRLGKVVVSKGKQAYENHKMGKALDEFDDDDEDFDPDEKTEKK